MMLMGWRDGPVVSEHTALPEELGLIPSTHTRQLSGLCGHILTHVVDIQRHTNK